MKRFRHQFTKIQLQERHNRKHRALLMKGVPTPPGTKPKVYVPTSKPWFKPMPGPTVSERFWDRLAARFGFTRKHPEAPKDILPQGIYKER